MQKVIKQIVFIFIQQKQEFLSRTQSLIGKKIKLKLSARAMSLYSERKVIEKSEKFTGYQL